MMGLGLGLGLYRGGLPIPAWHLPGGLNIDYTNGRGSPALGFPPAVNTRVSSVLALNSGGSYQLFPPNTWAQTDLGGQVVPSRVQIHPDPADFSTANWTRGTVTPAQDITIAGLPASTLTESGSTALLRTTSTFAVASASTYVAVFALKRINSDWVLCQVRDSTAGTNSIRVWVNLATRAKGTVAAVGTGYGHVSSEVIQSSNGQDCYLVVVFTAPTTAVCLSTSSAIADADTNRNNIGGGAGIGSAYGLGFVNVYLGTFMVPPILSASTVNGDQAVIPWDGSQMVGFIHVGPDWKGDDFTNVLYFSDGTINNRAIIRRNGSNLEWLMTAGGVLQAQIAIAGIPTAAFVLAFIGASNYANIQLIGGGAGVVDTTVTFPSGLTSLALGGRGFDAAQNAFQRTRKLSLKKGPFADPAAEFAAAIAAGTLALAA